jgi:succinyl-CoA synthetase beta subunit
MNLFEYEARELFTEAGIAVPEGVLLSSAGEVSDAVSRVGLPCVVKAQVLRGGRGKAGLIRFARTLEEAQQAVEELLLESDVNRLLIVRKLSFDQELYVSLTVDPVSAGYLLIGSACGGVEIEQLSERQPELVVQERIDCFRGYQPYIGRRLGFRMGLPASMIGEFSRTVARLWELCIGYEAQLAEINPLFLTAEGQLWAADAKFSIDDHALFRQSRFSRTRERFSSELEYEAAAAGIPYLQFDGDIGLMCAGAGLTTVVYDLISYAGGSVANYLEFGGPNYRRAEEALALCLRTSSKVILVVTFGTIARADVMAEGLAAAAAALRPDRPIIACIRGTGEEKASAVLEAAGIEQAADTESAVARAVELAGRGKE